MAYHSTPLLNDSPDLHVERQLMQQHFDNIHANQDRYNASGPQYMQPVNKGEPCKVSIDIFDSRATPGDGSFILWEGACSQGFADGFGRVYLMRSTSPILELLTKLDANSLELNTVYYFKDTSVQGQTIFFYGKSNRHKASGITITQRELDDNFTVAMLTLDKDNLISYQKESSLNSRYVLDTLGLSTYSHIIYDLRHTGYRSVSINYKMIDRNGKNVGYSILGSKDGTLIGREEKEHNLSAEIEPSDDMVKRVIEVVDKVDTNIEESLTSVLEAQPVVEVYKQVICKTDYQSALCDRLRCKNICTTDNTITPNDPRVKELLLFLVQEHNNEAIRSYLRQAIQKRHFQKLPSQMPTQAPKRRSDPLLPAVQSAVQPTERAAMQSQ